MNYYLLTAHQAIKAAKRRAIARTIDANAKEMNIESTVAELKEKYEK